VLTPTRYALAGDVHIAYRTMGDGPIDLVVSLGYISHVEHELTEPRVRAFFDRLATFSRVIFFDRRGAGLSDPVEYTPTLEDQVDDVRAVLDAVGSERAAILGHTGGSPFAMMFAATEPDRISHLVLFAGFARTTSTSDYPHGNTPEIRDAIVSSTLRSWGSGAYLALAVPSLLADPEFRDWFAALERLSSPPGATAKFFAMLGDIDVRPLLPAIKQPTLVMYPSSTPMVEEGHSLYLAEHIENAQYKSLPGADVLAVTPEACELYAGEIEEFLTGSRPALPSTRALRTVLFTDIVDSTQQAAQLGDSKWRDVLDSHDRIVRRELSLHRGVEVNTTGDGFFATFDGPERAIRCALAVSEALEPVGLTVRSGLHTGECEVRGEDLGGMTVHIGARVAAMAGPHEVLVSQTVRDLVVGSELDFNDRGDHELKGVPGTWHLFAAA
jgi:class 3 adenylate cyclase